LSWSPLCNRNSIHKVFSPSVLMDNLEWHDLPMCDPKLVENECVYGSRNTTIFAKISCFNLMLAHSIRG
jgi:hypothetical protein